MSNNQLNKFNSHYQINSIQYNHDYFNLVKQISTFLTQYNISGIMAANDNSLIKVNIIVNKIKHEERINDAV